MNFKKWFRECVILSMQTLTISFVLLSILCLFDFITKDLFFDVLCFYIFIGAVFITVETIAYFILQLINKIK